VGALPVSVEATSPVTTPPMPLSKSGLLLPGTSGPGVKSRTVPVSVVVTANDAGTNALSAPATDSMISFFMARVSSVVSPNRSHAE
jgi:hypothetical protein